MASILAVDDSASMRQMVSFTLKGAGHTVVESVDGVDALNKAKLQTFECVVTDVNMPNKDGITLIRDLRALNLFLCLCSQPSQEWIKNSKAKLLVQQVGLLNLLTQTNY